MRGPGLPTFGNPHLTLVTLIPFARIALHTAEPEGFGVSGCCSSDFETVPTKPLPPMTTTFCNTPIPDRGSNGTAWSLVGSPSRPGLTVVAT